MRTSLALVVLASVACGSPVTTTNDVDDASPARPSELRVRPKGVALQISSEQSIASGGVRSLAERDRIREIKAEMSGDVSPLFTVGGAPLTIFMNRNQQTYTGGADNAAAKRSSVVGSGTATVGAYRGTEAQWQAIMSCVQQQFAQFNVNVVDVDPGAGEYVECHIGGSPGQVGMPNGVGGVAPIDQFSCNIIPRAVVYVFSDAVGNGSQINCEIAAQEIAHAFSLDHEFLCQDPMTYLSGCGAKSFQNVDAQCGEFEPRQCGCTGARQNSVERMLEVIGPSNPTPVDPNDTVAPTASITSPANDATIQSSAQGTNITITATATDNGTITATDLIWDFTGDVFTCPGTFNGGGVTCTRSGSTSTWNILVGLGDRRFRLRVRDGGGNETITPDHVIHLTTDGAPPPPPPEDNIAPVVTVSSPSNGAELLANSTIQVVAEASDNLGLAEVELLWNFPQQQAFTCPIQQQSISCAVNGNTRTWSLNVGSGVRAFQVRATDVAGNVTTTPERTITLTTDPAEPPPDTGNDNDLAEPNNDPNAAFATRCGSAVDVVATPGDQDWYLIEAPEGTNVQVGATTAGQLEIAITDVSGQTILAETANAVSGESIAAQSAGPAVLARVTTSGAQSVPYRLAITCGNDEEVPPPPGVDDELEPNNGADAATRSFCGQERAGLAALDEDFYVVTVRPGDTLQVRVDGAGASAVIVDAEGNSLSEPGAETSASDLPGGDVYVKVAPEADGASYDMALICNATVTPTPITTACACSASSPNQTVWLVAGLLGLLILRRRS